MKRRILTLAIVVLFALTLVPVLGGSAATISAELERIDLPALSPASGANNNDTQMGWATEGFEDEDTAMDVEASIAYRAVYLALEMADRPHFLQFILQTPAGWWQQSEYDDDDLENFWDGSVLRLPFTGDWDTDDIRCKFLLGYYDDGPMDLGITGQWLEVAAEVEEGDLVELRLLDPASGANNNDTQMGWATQGFEGEDTVLDVAASIALRATHLVLEMPEAPHFLQFILQTPDGWWQQSEYGDAELAGFWDDATNRLSLPFTGTWHPDDIRAKFLLGYYDDGPMDLGITGVWLLVGPEVTLGVAEAPRELPAIGSLPFDLGVGAMIWGDQFAQLGWNGDTRAIAEKAPFDGGGLTTQMIIDANWFVIYVDNAPDDEEVEMISLMIFGHGNEWAWGGGTMEAPTVQLYDADLGAIVFPIGGHPFVEAAKVRIADGACDPDDRNFGICFTYGSGDDGTGGIENLGVTKVTLYVDRPSAGSSGGEETTPPPAVDPTPAPAAPADSSFPWLWVIIGGAAVVVIVVVIVIINKKK